jgi:predicted amidohydrolase YtcJ
LTVLKRDLTAIPKEEIGDIPVELTMVDGKVVYQHIPP